MSGENRNDTALPHRLTLIAEKKLPAKCKPGMLTYCPTMDLVALATQDEQLSVFRLNGQKVLGVDFAGDPYLDEVKGEVRFITWKHDGQLLSVADSENKVRIISSFSGKTVHYYPTCAEDNTAGNNGSPRVSCMNWGVNLTDIKAARDYLQVANGQLTAEDLLTPDSDPARAAMLLKADLPRELALLDVESSLPKLSTLSGNGDDEDVFSSRASIDAIFHSPQKSSNDLVDVLFVAFSDGGAHLRIFNCFEIGNFPLASDINVTPPVEALVHTSHPLSSTHAVLTSERGEITSSSVLRVITLDLRFIVKCGRYLYLLASKITQLQNLLRYINQTQRQIMNEWKNIHELPTRFLRSVADELQEKCHCDVVTALYHLVVTGNCFPPIKEFLVDIVGERGHKRWEKTVSAGYENLRRLIHECLLPALERCEVLLSRLIGISKFHKLNHVLGLETRDLQDIVETVDALHLHSHTMLTKSSAELAQFLEFSRWLRHEIDIQTAEPMSQTLADLQEKSDDIDHVVVLDYIQGALTKSALRLFISSTLSAPTGHSNWWDCSGEHQGSFYEAYKHALSLQGKEEQRQPPVKEDSSHENFPKLNNLIGRFGSQCSKVFKQIALTQKRSILQRCLLELHPDCDKRVVDTSMQYESANENQLFCVYVAARLNNSLHTLLIYRNALEITNGVSSSKGSQVSSISLSSGEIKQVQFLEDGTIVVLHTDDANQSHLVNFSIKPTPTQSKTSDEASSNHFRPRYESHNTNNSLPVPQKMDLRGSEADLVLHSFPPRGSKSRPVRFYVSGRRKERRTVCVLYADQMHYEVLDIDNQEQGEDEDKNKEMEE